MSSRRKHCHMYEHQTDFERPLWRFHVFIRGWCKCHRVGNLATCMNTEQVLDDRHGDATTLFVGGVSVIATETLSHV